MLKERFTAMLSHERALWTSGRSFIAGADEVGRGPLAGPVAAAAVILPQNFDLLEVNDSKKLSPGKRNSLSALIKERALAYAIAWVDPARIDEINILEATKEAMTAAVNSLKLRPDHLLIDGNFTLKSLDMPQTSIVKGDSASVSIAAASIIAKVARDEYMTKAAERFPGYAFENNKGYGTAAHYAGLEKLGACPIHRRSFISEKYYELPGN